MTSLNTLAMMLFQHTRGIGFFGHEGIIWAFIGFVFTVAVIAILFKITKLLLPALGIGEPWATIVYWVMVLMCLFLFMNYAFGGWF